MDNPSLLLCDSDATIQLLLTDRHNLLKLLSSGYSIQPVIVHEVENEIRQNKKYKAYIGARFDKVLQTGVIKIFDSLFLQTHLKTSGLPATTIQATWDAIQAMGQQYELRVGSGEAYTYAAAVSLEVPALSHDAQALNTLLNLNMNVPKPVIRVFDLLGLFNQCEVLSVKDCDDTRSKLLAHSEWLPRDFLNAGYEQGLETFCVRIQDQAIAAIGCAPTGQRPYSQQIFIRHQGTT